MDQGSHGRGKAGRKLYGGGGGAASGKTRNLKIFLNFVSPGTGYNESNDQEIVIFVENLPRCVS